MPQRTARRASEWRSIQTSLFLVLAASATACGGGDEPAPPAPATVASGTGPAASSSGAAGGASGAGGAATAQTEPQLTPEQAALVASPGFQLFRSAQEAVQAGDIDTAIQRLEQAIKKDAERPEFFDGLYKLWIRQGQYPDAIAVLQRAIEHTPDRPDFWYNLGILEMRLGGFEQAEQCLARATQLAPDMVLAHFQLGYNHYQQGTLIVGALSVDHERMKLALQSYDRALAFDPNFSDAHYWSGMAHVALHDYDAALVSFEKAIEAGATRIGPYLEAADLYLQDDEIEAAERLYREAASVGVEWAQPFVGLGRIEERRGDYLAALRQYETAQAIDPEVAGIYRGLATCHRRLGNEERADAAQAKFDELSKVEEAERNNRITAVKGQRAEDLYNMGVALQDENRLEEAFVAYQKAVASNPDHSNAHMQLGEMYQVRGEMTLAMEHLKKAAQADRTNLRAAQLLRELRGLLETLPMVEEPAGSDE